MKKYLSTLTMFFLVINSFGQSFTETKKAAEQGDADAQYNLGTMYSKGKGTLTDIKQAFYWWKKAAEQGDAEAQCYIGAMYYNGDGT
ncbi:MAG: sel1 repeat family protein, partial [Flavobacteriaceae bacterium]|nr:sel1 repeat family protein [Flavobacteriaceae bacterium]